MKAGIKHALIIALAIAAAPPWAGDALWTAGQGQSEAIVESTKTSSWIGVWLVDEVDGGARVVALVPGGPAERGGLRVGDIIVEANGQAVPRQATLTAVLRSVSPGTAIPLQVLRDGASIERSLEVAARPVRQAVTLTYARPAHRGLDLEVSEITPALREHYGAPRDAGVLVVRADPEGLGGASGIRVGDVLVRVGDDIIVNARQVRWMLWQPGPGETLEAQVVRKGKTRTVRLTPLESGDDPEQDDQVSEHVGNEAVVRRLRLELERLERRMSEIRRELSRIEPEHEN